MDGSASQFVATGGASLADVSGVPVWTRRLLRRLGRQWRNGTLLITLPNGVRLRVGGSEPGPNVSWTVHRWNALLRMVARGDIGVAEGYLAGEWDTPDLASLLTAFATNYDALEEIVRGLPLLRGFNAIGHALSRNSRAGSRRNIMAHYDLGNEFYKLWLDPSMTYSSAVFDPPGLSLEQAQRQKNRALAVTTGIKSDDRVLEIGCGWGGFSAFAAGEIGAHVTAITLSPAQLDVAQKRVFDMGLAERVDVRLIDYRDIEGHYDRIVSVEMFEAVGEAYWSTYFGKIKSLLKPGGRAGLQIITIQDKLFETYRRRPDFIQLHVFPGGMLPGEAALRTVVKDSGLEMEVTRRFGRDYAETLRLWGSAFDLAWPDMKPLGFDERFRRLWRYYLAYCQAGFTTGRTDVVQLALTH